MVIPAQPNGAYEWALTNFGEAAFTDVRRVARLVSIAEAALRSPTASWPQRFAQAYDLKATYNFFRDPEATPANIQFGHREELYATLSQPGTYLFLEDTSEIFCASGNTPIPGLGPVGASTKKGQGFLLHTDLAVAWPGADPALAPRRPPVLLLGIAAQQYHIRQLRPKAAGPRQGSERRTLPASELESALWEQASSEIGRAPADEAVRWIKVGDRGADIYDHLVACQAQGQRFVIRAKSDRVLVDEAGVPVGKLFAEVRGGASLGSLELSLRARPGQRARVAQLEVTATAVRLRAPQAKGQGAGGRAPVSCWAVRVWEPAAPEGVRGLEWLLLTDIAVTDFVGACEIIQMYATRWVEEEFHKALKSGLKVEQGQFRSAAEWLAAVAVLSVVGVRLVGLREQARVAPEAAAESSGLGAEEIEVLRAQSGKKLATVGEVVLALGRLGGHLNRKGDGPPGWQTMWRGWQRLEDMMMGYRLGQKKMRTPEQQE